MRLLWIATKTPVPPVDGGRLVQKLTLEALAAAGVELTVVAPLFPGLDGDAVRDELEDLCAPQLALHLPAVPSPRPLLPSLVDALPGRLPLALARHAHRAVRRRVASLLDGALAFDAVHVEQLHALPQAEPAWRRRLPVVLRQQNVESDLWRLASAGFPAGLRTLASWEARRLARWEGEAVRRVAATVALTPQDAHRLQGLAVHRVGRQRESRPVEVVPAPFPAHLAPGGRPLPGAPPVVVLGSAGWPPNRDAETWMRSTLWPAVRRRAPEAVLHLFGGPGASRHDPDTETRAGVVRHGALADSADAFAPGAVLAVPLRLASGVRMKILEAWARGVPVVATPVAAAGLDAEDGRELLLADDAEGFAAAVARLATRPHLAETLVAGGRAALARHHDPASVARELLRVYAAAAEASRGARRGAV